MKKVKVTHHQFRGGLKYTVEEYAPANPFIEIDTRCHKCGRVAGQGARDSRVFAMDIDTVRLYYCSECAGVRPVTKEWRDIMYHAMMPKRPTDD